MATPQALGSGLGGYNPFLPPDANAKLMQIQQQQALSHALLEQGLQPVDTNNRMMGQIAYKISPTEGLSKIAQMLVGEYGQQQAIESQKALAQGLSGGGSNGGGNSMPGGSSGMLAAMYPEIAAKSMLDSYYGDHRPGATYRDATGNLQVAPTDLQTNSGIPPAGAQPIGMQPPPPDVGGGVGAPQMPVQGPQPMPPPSAGGQAVIPPMDANALGQGASPGLPPPPPGIQLSGPPPAQAAPQAAPPTADMPTPYPGESPLHFQARLGVATEGAKAQAAAQGKNEAEANLNSAQIGSRIDNALKNVNEMIGQVPNTSTGIPHISQETQQDILRRSAPDMAAANTRFEQLNNQLYVQELGPLIKQLGGRGNMFVENAVKQGSAVDIRGNDREKLQALQGIKEYLNNIKQNAANQSELLKGNPIQQAPTNNAVTHKWTPQGIVPMGQQ